MHASAADLLELAVMSLIISPVLIACKLRALTPGRLSTPAGQDFEQAQPLACFQLSMFEM